MLKKLIIIILFILGILHGENINIAVAANVSYAMDDIKKEFKKLYPNVNLKVTLGSSGKLTAQIKNGAPYQLFMSANMKYPKVLYNEKIAITKPVVYAQGLLAILSNNQKNFQKGIEIIDSNLIKKIAIANPKTAPYGKASVEAIKNAHLYKKSQSKFIYAESISQTVSYTVIAADIGFIAKSSLYSSKMSKYKEHINWEEVDSNLYNPIKQGIVILKNGQNNSDVKAFYDFILSSKAQKIFKDYGYLVQ